MLDKQSTTELATSLFVFFSFNEKIEGLKQSDKLWFHQSISSTCSFIWKGRVYID